MTSWTAEKAKKREYFLLAVISYLDDMDSWYLDQYPDWIEKLKIEFDWQRPRERE
jgi:hypothetical protein